jgi:hypothetical protein
MDTSRETFAQVEKRRHRAVERPQFVGLCLKCCSRLTLCGKPFSADIRCSKCFIINVFRDSQQPVAVRDMDGKEIT